MAQPAKPPKSILKPVGRAIARYGMIRDGDRVLLGLSGGKDSLSLLQVLMHLKGHAPVSFDLAAVTIDPLIEGFDPRVLGPYLEELGLPWHYEREELETLAGRHMKHDSFCSFCARVKRGIMYRVAREQGCNVLALAQHLDDLAESFLMSAFHEGRLNTMKAHYLIDAGDIRVIRPLVAVRERQLADFAREAALPVVPDSCPACFSKPTQRAHMKTLLAAEERANPHLFKTLLHTMEPLLADGRGRDGIAAGEGD